MNELDNKQGNDAGLRELALFAGAGGGILGGKLLGWNPVCAVEYNAYARSVLLARQNDGTLPPFPIWDDVRTFDGMPWRGRVDVVSGGFPCQDISAAGKGAGLNGERSGLWSEMARIIREIRPQFVLVENSPVLTSRGLGRVLGDLAEMGFDAEWGVVSAADTGAPHLRERIWIVAHANGMRELQPERRISDLGRRVGDGGTDLADAMREHEQGVKPSSLDAKEWRRPEQRQAGSCCDGFGRWPAEPAVGRVVNGLAHRSDRLKALGNGQVSRVVAAAWNILYRRLNHEQLR